jgi:hypothetical protein
MNSMPSADRDAFDPRNDAYDSNPYSTATRSEATPVATASAITWWRWPLIPIAAPTGAILGSTLLGIVQWFGMKMNGGFHEDGWYYLYVMPLITSGVFGWLWCYISASLAPKGKTITGAVMATILALLSVFLIFVSFMQLESTTGERIQLVLASIAILIGSIIAVAQTHDEGKA